MTLKQKREIVEAFLRGTDLWLLIHSEPLNDPSLSYWEILDKAEQVLRDFMNGKFRLEKR